MTSTHMTRYSPSLIIKEVQAKATMLYLHTFTKMANLQMAGNSKCWQKGEEQLKYSVSACRGKIDKTALEVRLAVVFTKVELMQKQGPSKSTLGMHTT